MGAFVLAVQERNSYPNLPMSHHIPLLRRHLKPHTKVALAYLGFGLLWIFLSDRLLLLMVNDREKLSELQTYKGWAFVVLSSLLVYTISRLAHHQEVKREKEKTDLFRYTVRAAQHIVLNFLNQIQLLKITAESSSDFDQETLDVCEQVTRESKDKLMVLGRIEQISKDEIDRIVYPG